MRIWEIDSSYSKKLEEGLIGDTVNRVKNFFKSDADKHGEIIDKYLIDGEYAKPGLLSPFKYGPYSDCWGGPKEDDLHLELIHMIPIQPDHNIRNEDVDAYKTKLKELSDDEIAGHRQRLIHDMHNAGEMGNNRIPQMEAELDALYKNHKSHPIKYLELKALLAEWYWSNIELRSRGISPKGGVPNS